MSCGNPRNRAQPSASLYTFVGKNCPMTSKTRYAAARSHRGLTGCGCHATPCQAAQRRWTRLWWPGLGSKAIAGILQVNCKLAKDGSGPFGCRGPEGPLGARLGSARFEEQPPQRCLLYIFSSIPHPRYCHTTTGSCILTELNRNMSLHVPPGRSVLILPNILL